MVDSEEISDNEAMFRYLNLIDVEISKNNNLNTVIIKNITMIIIRDVCFQFI